MSELKRYIDETLKNEYELTDILSETAVNRISLYKHRQSEKALLLIKSDYRNDEVFRILRGIDTRGLLPTIYEVASEEDALYVLEEYIEGTPLSEVIASKRLTAKEIKGYAVDICNALDILHKNGIIHRDIKPENIIIKKDMSACVIDLSIARTINGDKTKDTINLGTIGYAAPEQFGFSQSQPATDIYSLGVLINKLALGVHPSMDTPKGRIGRIVTKCTYTRISKRYRSIDELRRAVYRI